MAGNASLLSEAMKALGDPTRLQIAEFLSRCETSAPSAGEVCRQVAGTEKINSTISHHLHELRNAGVIRIERQGKQMCCSLNRQTLRVLARSLDSLAAGARTPQD